MWPFTRSHWIFQQPPCICEEIEAHVRAACALRDEMATWDTPVNEWKKLQQMQVLRPKAEPQPFIQPVDVDFGNGWTGRGVQVSTCTDTSVVSIGQRGGITARTIVNQVPVYDGRRGFVLQLRPGEPFEVGSIIKREDARYQITQRLFDNTNRVMAKRMRWPP